MDQTEFQDIAPFNDEEAEAALTRLSNHPNVPWISQFIFPDEKPTFLRDLLRSIHTVDEFQQAVMVKAVQWVIDTSVNEFSYAGLEKLNRAWKEKDKEHRRGEYGKGEKRHG